MHYNVNANKMACVSIIKADQLEHLSHKFLCSNGAKIYFHVQSDDSDQTRWMFRLIQAIAERTYVFTKGIKHSFPYINVCQVRLR